MLKLQELRNEKRLSQAEIAKLLGTNQQAYSRYERGEREMGYNTLIKFAKFFDVSVDYLIGNSAYYYPDSITSEDERELLALYGEMNPAQKARFVAYAEGLLNKSVKEKKE